MSQSGKTFTDSLTFSNRFVKAVIGININTKKIYPKVTMVRKSLFCFTVKI